MSKSMSNEQDIVQHFCEPSNTLFLCVLWQMLLEKDEIQPTAYKVLLYCESKSNSNKDPNFKNDSNQSL